MDAFPEAMWSVDDALGLNTHRATNVLFGRALRPVYDLTHADIIVSVEADFLHTMDGALRACARLCGSPTYSLPRHHCQQSPLCPRKQPDADGSGCDHRIPLRASALGPWIRKLAAQLGVQGANDGANRSAYYRVAGDPECIVGGALSSPGDEQPGRAPYPRPCHQRLSRERWKNRTLHRLS
ncbi:MAG: hypothetical protein R3C68_06930 [Myxococcota bacterium]